MPLQTSGQISMSDIGGEKPTLAQDMSLAAMSSLGVNSASSFKPDGNAPHAMSEFYGYNHSASSGPSVQPVDLTSQTYPSYYGAEILCNNNVLQTYWTDGTHITPKINDRIYTNSAGTSTLNSKHVGAPWGEVYTTNGSGYITSIHSCSGGGGEEGLR